MIPEVGSRPLDVVRNARSLNGLHHVQPGMDDIERQAIRAEGRDPDDWRVQLGQHWVSLLLQEHARTVGIPPRYPGPLP